MLKKRLLLLLFIVSVVSVFPQQIDDDNLDEFSLKYAKASFPELHEFFSLPNDAYYPEDIEKNVKWCENAFGYRGFKTSLPVHVHQKQSGKKFAIPGLFLLQDYPRK